MSKRPLVRNAASAKQVRHAERKTKDRRQNELLDLHELLSHEVGRRVLWRVLSFCGVHQTVLRESPVAMAEAAGRQNVGHYLMAEIEAANSEALFTMMREARDGEARDARETAAVQTTSRQENPDDDDSSEA